MYYMYRASLVNSNDCKDNAEMQLSYTMLDRGSYPFGRVLKTITLSHRFVHSAIKHSATEARLPKIVNMIPITGPIGASSIPNTFPCLPRVSGHRQLDREGLLQVVVAFNWLSDLVALEMSAARTQCRQTVPSTTAVGPLHRALKESVVPHLVLGISTNSSGSSASSGAAATVSFFS
jgi:hypothetical protein